MPTEAFAALLLLVPLILAAQDGDGGEGGEPAPDPLAPKVQPAAELIGLEFTDKEIELMADELAGQLASYAALRAADLPNAVAPAGTFTPLVPGVVVRPHGVESLVPTPGPPARGSADGPLGPIPFHANPFDSISMLGLHLRSGRISCVELTRFYLDRLEALHPTLECVVTLLPERALAQAAERDAELAEGIDRGPLHGIPWGAKDLLSVAGAPTTWGAAPYRDQVLDQDAEVVRRLDEAGAVLVAKLSLGALAWGDVWFGGTTRNPWNSEQGSSGSSAGSASAVAAGAVPFAIGSETLGSLVSPSVRCGVTSLRPSFGRISRTGAMTLSWSMDKLGPMTRSIEDATLVFDALRGPAAEGELDLAVLTVPADLPEPDFHMDDFDRFLPLDLRVGIPVGAEEDPILVQALAELHAALVVRNLDLETVPFEVPDYPVGAMLLTLTAEAAAAFDELTTSGLDDGLTRQSRDAWPNVFRAARLIPAVEYINAQRLRAGLVRDMEAGLQGVDLVLHPPFAGGILSATNLTGHPTVTAPIFLAEGDRPNHPRGICFTGRLYDEPWLLAVARLWQETGEHHLRHPDLDLDSPAPDPGAPAEDR